MIIRDIKAFIQLAEKLHYASTADILHISTSTLTRIVQRLEESVGTPLFQRDTRDVKLTREGKLFLDFAVTTLDNWQKMKVECTDQHHIKGELSLFCTVTAAHLFLSSLIHQFRQDFPLVKLSLETGDVEDAYKKVANQEANIAFAIREDGLNKKFYFQSITNIPLVLVAPKQPQKWSSRSHSSMIKWEETPFIMPESKHARKNVQQWFDFIGVKPKVYAKVSGHEAMVSLVALGCGISIVPLPVWQNSPVKDHVIELQVPTLPKPFELGLLCLDKQKRLPAINAFYQLMVERV
ncbi:MAG: HTH-type transcriptional activator IlvY [Gammaproteobacteria bacterium]|nr:HTH-type transcriptional activator IlvY [Gammaproteobacteria bacterium]